jgi:hypothetical protein
VQCTKFAFKGLDAQSNFNYLLIPCQLGTVTEHAVQHTPELVPAVAV